MFRKIQTPAAPDLLQQGNFFSNKGGLNIYKETRKVNNHPSSSIGGNIFSHKPKVFYSAVKCRNNDYYDDFDSKLEFKQEKDVIICDDGPAAHRRGDRASPPVVSGDGSPLTFLSTAASPLLPNKKTKRKTEFLKATIN